MLITKETLEDRIDAWRLAPFPKGIYCLNAEYPEPHIMLANTYAAGCFLYFRDYSYLDKQRYKSLHGCCESFQDFLVAMNGGDEPHKEETNYIQEMLDIGRFIIEHESPKFEGI